MILLNIPDFHKKREGRSVDQPCWRQSQQVVLPFYVISIYILIEAFWYIWSTYWCELICWYYVMNGCLESLQSTNNARGLWLSMIVKSWKIFWMWMAVHFSKTNIIELFKLMLIGLDHLHILIFVYHTEGQNVPCKCRRFNDGAGDHITPCNPPTWPLWSHWPLPRATNQRII